VDTKEVLWTGVDESLRVSSIKMRIQLIAPHQTEGVEWMVNREKAAEGPRGGLLCDEMGLGKTVQMLETMVRNFKRRSLIVVPKSIVEQWLGQIRKFTPQFTVCVYAGPKREFQFADICICPYSVLRDLTGVEWGRVILDEGHEIRNKKSMIHQICMDLVADVKWILTGTPIFNRMSDFVNLCEFVGVSRYRVMRSLDDVKKEYVLRRTRDVTNVNLEFSVVELEMHPEEEAFYDSVYHQLMSGMFEFVLEGILRCRQASVWAPMCDGPPISAKMDKLIEFIREHPDEKSLVFTQFRKESREIQRRVQLMGLSVFILDGQTENREMVIESFRLSSPGSVFLIQIKAGGTGLNLQEATRVYITQPSWNPATELQAIARSFRIGQTRDVCVKKLLYTGIDNKMAKLQGIKSGISRRVVDKEIEIPAAVLNSTFEIELGGRNE
jgi:SNF2 family DNA or RNA helicase